MANVVSLLTQLFTPTGVHSAGQVVSKPSNPYSNNPFVNYNGYQYSSSTYAKNKPVSGGYFAGYMAQYTLYGQLIKQSTLWAFMDAFRIFGILCIVIIPLLLLLDSKKRA